jgi:hypothetical protein
MTEPQVDTFARRRLTWEDVQARIALSPLHGQRTVLVSQVWGDWQALVPFLLLSATESPRGHRSLNARNMHGEMVGIRWDEARLYAVAEDD